MDIKKTVFGVMCALIAIVIVLTCIVVSKVGSLFETVEPSLSGTMGTTLSSGTDGSTAATEPSQTTPAQPTETTTPIQTTAPTQPDHVHSYELTESAEVSCEYYGYNIYTCTICGEQNIPTAEMVAPLGHNFGAGQVITPTCTEDGCTLYTCTRCGKTEQRNVKEATGHSYVFVTTVEAQCGSVGYDLYSCDVCGAEEHRNEIAALEHSYTLVKKADPTCTEDGFELYRCNACGTENDVTVPTQGHRYTGWIQEDDGTFSHTCEACGLTESTKELRITNTRTSADDGTAGKVYVITVGTEQETELFSYTIYDHLNNGTLNYSVDPVRGLVVTYTGADGTNAETAMDFFRTEPLEIPAG